MGVLAVTGATGRVGGRVARALGEAGTPVRLLVRDPARAPGVPGAEVRQASYGDGDASRRALEGVDVLLMVSAAEAEDRRAQHLAFVAAAADAGVQHVVYTSFYGASPTCTFTLGRDHHATEEALRGSVPSWTFLRDNLYADFLPLLAGEDGAIRGPAGDGRLSAVAIEDVADVATAVLQDPGAHRRVTYDLTGPEAVTLAEAAARAGAVTGRPLRYVEEALEEAYRSREVYGAPRWQVDAWVSTYTAIAAGEVAGVSGDVEKVLGRAPRSLEDVFRAQA